MLTTLRLPSPGAAVTPSGRAIGRSPTVDSTGPAAPAVDPALELLRAYLASLDDPEAGAALLRLHAPTAPLFIGARIAARADLVERDFVDAHRAAVTAARFDARAPFLCRPELLDEQRGPDGRVLAWFHLLLRGSDEPLLAAAGFEPHGDTLLLGWTVLAERREAWSYEAGRLRTLAELSFLEPPGVPPARSWLEASLRRLRPDDSTPLLLPAESGFSCHGSGACCRHDYGIVLAPGAQAFVDAMPWERIRPALAGTRLAALPSGELRLKDQHETCRFLDDDRQCVIHRELGFQPFAPCSVFPFSFARTPEGVVATTSSLCPSVRTPIGEPSPRRERDVRARLAVARPRTTDAYRLAPGIEVSWDTFRTIEAALRDLLDENALPFDRRLYVGNRLLAACIDGAPRIDAAWFSEPYLPLDDSGRGIVGTFLARILGWQRAALLKLPQGPLPSVHHGELHDQPILVELIRTLHFSKVYSYPFDLVTAHNFATVLYALALLLQARTGTRLTNELWEELSALGHHGLLRSLLPEPPTPGDTALRAFLGAPLFGALMLAFPDSA